MRSSGISLIALAASLAATLTSVAVAQKKTDRPIHRLRQATLLEKYGDQGIDANGDGVLTEGEVRAFVAAHGGKLPDPKVRGRGSKGRAGGVDELLQRLATVSAETPPKDFDLAKFPQADRDGDGRLSDPEWVDFAERTRRRILQRLIKQRPDADLDSDGKLSDAELAAFKKKRSAEIRRRILNRNPGADLDRNGVLSEAELEAFRAKRRERERARILDQHPEADLDDDGALSDEEVKTFRESRRDRARGEGERRRREQRHRGDGSRDR